MKYKLLRPLVYVKSLPAIFQIGILFLGVALSLAFGIAVLGWGRFMEVVGIFAVTLVFSTFLHCLLFADVEAEIGGRGKEEQRTVSPVYVFALPVYVMILLAFKHYLPSTFIAVFHVCGIVSGIISLCLILFSKQNGEKWLVVYWKEYKEELSERKIKKYEEKIKDLKDKQEKDAI